jgi:hypothetical protein
MPQPGNAALNMVKNRRSWVAFAILGVLLLVPIAVFIAAATLGQRSIVDAMKNPLGAYGSEGAAFAGLFILFYAWSLRGRRAAQRTP